MTVRLQGPGGGPEAQALERPHPAAGRDPVAAPVRPLGRRGSRPCRACGSPPRSTRCRAAAGSATCFPPCAGPGRRHPRRGRRRDRPGKHRESAGKYVSDNVFVEVERGVAEGTGKARVQVELTPNLSVSTEVTEQSQSRRRARVALRLLSHGDTAPPTTEAPIAAPDLACPRTAAPSARRSTSTCWACGPST